MHGTKELGRKKKDTVGWNAEGAESGKGSIP